MVMILQAIFVFMIVFIITSAGISIHRAIKYIKSDTNNEVNTNQDT